MSSSSAPSDYIPSDNDEDDDSDQNAATSADTDNTRPSQTPRRQSGQSDQAQLGPGSHDTAQQRALPQPRKLVDKSNKILESSQRKRSEGKSCKGKSGKSQSSESWSQQPRTAERRKEVKYCDVLNSVITERANGDKNDGRFGLVDSQIGASYWTAMEKDCLFRQLSKTGGSDLPALGHAIRTKSESEIQVYLKLLERESKRQSLQTPKAGFELIDQPAAWEISEACATALEEESISISTLVNERDVTLQQDEFGENWLIDEDAAYYIDLAFDLQDESASTKEEDGDLEDAAIDKVETEAQVEDEGSEPFTAKVETDDQIPDFTASVQDSDASIRLLRPNAFLHLSRNLFMNSLVDPSCNYQVASDLLPEPVESPAIFRGAFEDFYNLTVSLTRRLVRAALFQAMTRLRAWDSTTGRTKWTPLAAVREKDVRAALDVLGMRPDAKDWWAKAARRNGVEVYSESKKFLDGRQTTKNGVRLTHDEVESEMGLENQLTEGSIEKDMVEHDFEPESEDFTDTETEGEREQEPPLSQKRKRTQSPSAYLRSECRYLEALDHNASVDEEAHLWKVLRVRRPDNVDLEHVAVPAQRYQFPAITDDWRSKVEYEAEWENVFGCVEREKFFEMEARGVKRRKLKADSKRHGESFEGSDDKVEEMATSIEGADEQEADGRSNGSNGGTPATDSDQEMIDAGHQVNNNEEDD